MTMKAENRRPVLNRALFSGRALESGALAPLTTLLHRFTEPGDYELFVRRDGQMIGRSTVRVMGELPRAEPPRGSDMGHGDVPRGDMPRSAAGATYQTNIDLTAFGEAAANCAPEPMTVLATGGVLGFYVSQGTSHYTVTITRLVGDKKETVLDSTAGVPEGDFFAVTFVRPGIYTVANRLGQGQMKVEVKLPTEKGYRPNDGALVQVNRGGFDPNGASLYSGQSLLFQCHVAAQFAVELAQPAPETVRAADERRRHTVRKRRPPTP